MDLKKYIFIDLYNPIKLFFPIILTLIIIYLIYDYIPTEYSFENTPTNKGRISLIPDTTQDGLLPIPFKPDFVSRYKQLDPPNKPVFVEKFYGENEKKIKRIKTKTKKKKKKNKKRTVPPKINDQSNDTSKPDIDLKLFKNKLSITMKPSPGLKKSDSKKNKQKTSTDPITTEEEPHIRPSFYMIIPR